MDNKDHAQQPPSKKTKGEHIVSLFKAAFDPSKKTSIMTLIQHAEWVISQYILIDSPSPSKRLNIEQLSQLPEALNGMPIPITPEELSTLQTILSSLNGALTVHKEMQRLQETLNQKLELALEEKPSNAWSGITDWIDARSTSVLNHESVTFEPFQNTLNAWIMDMNRHLQSSLEQQIKDHLHAMVFQHIIHPKRHQSPEWGTLISKQPVQQNAMIQQLETDIRSAIDSLTKHIDAPFMPQFSKELFTRCYRRLLSPKETPVALTSISAITSDLNEPQKKPSWPLHIQHQFNQEYVAFLKSIIHNKPNVREYWYSKFKSLIALANDTTLNDNEKQMIQLTYQSIYKATRKYERLINALAKKIRQLDITHPLDLLKTLTHNIELTTHTYAHFVNAYNQQLHVLLHDNPPQFRKTHKDDIDHAVATLQRTNKIIQLSHLMNYFFNKHPATSLPQPLKDQLASHIANPKDALHNSMSPWSGYPWDNELATWVHAFGIHSPPNQAKRYPQAFKPPTPVETSSLISSPPHDPPMNQLNQTI
ncbi:MAG: hypothetical protein ISQ13_00975 [Candidatus Margulisbacteria bacterium]|nr:hypothetical protein [Candidatus Margulisiibacteriota bacterium]